MKNSPKMLYYFSILILAVFFMSLTATSALAFTDVNANAWYAETVEAMAAENLLSGYPDGSFRPESTISAAEFVAITARCADLTPISGQTSHWAANIMEAALRANWYDWDELPPTGEKFDQPIPRKLAVKVLMRALLPEIQGDYNKQSQKIRDFSELNGRYYEPVLAAYEAGIVSGDSNGCFRPESGLRRCEACVLFRQALKVTKNVPKAPTEQQFSPQPVQTLGDGVSKNGWLQVKGTQLCNEQGQPVALRGMSSHGIQWFSQFTGPQAIQNTAQYGANVFRVAMYTAENGYLSNPSDMQQKVIQAVDAAIACDMYVIIDWHILSDGNPMDHVSEAETFFSTMAQRYQNSPNVLYEICNEPNGNVSWSGDVKPYAQRIIQAIRTQSPQALILIGSPTWSQDIHLAAADPLEQSNLMYTFHFYAGTHGKDLQKRLLDALNLNLPVFVSEWGVSRADGSGGVFLPESAAWLDLLDQHGISWCAWSLCDKNESSAALLPGTPPDQPWSDQNFTQAGAFLFFRFSYGR